jgi:hypothetical protein
MLRIIKSTGFAPIAQGKLEALKEFKYKMPYYNECPVCHSTLDPGETCDCQKDKPNLDPQIKKSAGNNKGTKRKRPGTLSIPKRFLKNVNNYYKDYSNE